MRYPDLLLNLHLKLCNVTNQCHPKILNLKNKLKNNNGSQVVGKVDPLKE